MILGENVNMEIIRAKTAGFCFGVKRAVDMVYENIRNCAADQAIYTFGPIIHNETVIKELSDKGVKILDFNEGGFFCDNRQLSEDDLKGATIIIRSHGIEKKIFEKLERTGARIEDATCPFVKKIHRIVSDESRAGKRIVIIGDERDPEVQGIMSYCEGTPEVLDTVEKAQEITFESTDKVCVVSQTTFNYNKFQLLVEILTKKAYDISCVNTICHATSERQQEALQIAAQVDCMIVIGGTHSSNSRKLYEICRNECVNTYFCQTPDDLYLDLPESVRSVGITAGASTPKNIIEEVQNHVRTIF